MARILSYWPYRAVIAVAIGFVLTCLFLCFRPSNKILQKPDGNLSDMKISSRKISAELNVTRRGSELVLEGVTAQKSYNVPVIVSLNGDYYAFPEDTEYGVSASLYGTNVGTGNTSGSFKVSARYLRFYGGSYRVGVLSTLPDGSTALTLSERVFDSVSDPLLGADALVLCITFAILTLFSYAALYGAYLSLGMAPQVSKSLCFNVNNPIVSAANKIFLTLSAVGFLFALLLPFSDFLPQHVTRIFSVVCETMLCVLVIFFLYCVWFLSESRGIRGFLIKHEAVCIAVYFAALALLQWAVFSKLDIYSGWDVAVLYNSALEAAEGFPVSNWEYFAYYPHNEFTLLIMSLLAKLALPFGTAAFKNLLTAGNILLYDLSVLLAFLCAKNLFGKKCAYVLLALLTALVAFSPWISFFYTDGLGIVFPICIFYLYVLFKKTDSYKTRLACALAVGIFTWLGFKVKPTVALVTLSVFIIEILSHKKTRTFCARFIALACAFVSGAFIGVCVTGFPLVRGIRYAPEYYEKSPLYHLPVTHHILLGQTAPYGGYNAKVFMQSQNTPAENRVGTHLESISSNITEMGALGYADFLLNKFNYTVSDGNFFFGGEDTGNNYLSDPKDSVWENALIEVFSDVGSYWPFMALLRQALWAVVWFFIAWPFIAHCKCCNGYVCVLRLSLLLLIAYLMVSETRSRQLICFLPIFALLAAFSFRTVFLDMRKRVLKSANLC